MFILLLMMMVGAHPWSPADRVLGVGLLLGCWLRSPAGPAKSGQRENSAAGRFSPMILSEAATRDNGMLTNKVTRGCSSLKVNDFVQMGRRRRMVYSHPLLRAKAK